MPLRPHFLFKIGSSRPFLVSPVIREQVGTSRDNCHHPMKQPRKVPPASFSALGFVCSSKTYIIRLDARCARWQILAQVLTFS